MLKEFRPDMLRHLELLDLETGSAYEGKDASDQKQHWTSIMVRNLFYHKTQMRRP